MLRNLLRWARITKAAPATGQQFSTQQVEYLGKLADAATLYPYGVYANMPPDVLVLIGSVQDHPDNRVALGCLNKDRPTLEEGEVAFYHPPTDAFIIWRQSGDLDIETGDGGTANVNVNCKQANITASESMTFDTPDATFTGNLQVDGSLNSDGAATLGGPGGAEIARKGDAVAGGVIVGGSSFHKAT